jgi:hypothetical protein
LKAEADIRYWENIISRFLNSESFSNQGLFSQK